MRRVPLWPTALVALAVAAMVALGLWQLLDRWPAKLALLAQLERNPSLPPVAFPRVNDDRLLFRRTRAYCVPPPFVRLAGAGAAGYRALAECRTDTGAPPLTVQIGTTRNSHAQVHWQGGWVAGYVGHAPTGQSMIGRLVAPIVPQPLLVAGRPAAGLTRNTPPDTDAVPNNHLAYAVQWFVFAAIAATIYALALRRRNAGA